GGGRPRARPPAPPPPGPLVSRGSGGGGGGVPGRGEAGADGRTGAVDLPGRSWRDRPAVDRGDGVYLAGDQVAAPGVLAEVSFNSAVTAVSLILGRPALDLKHA
ncbi:hypothetical protein ACWGKX_24110, partial [Streptomyces tricolor]